MALDIDWRVYKSNKEVYGNLPCASFKIQERRMKLAGHLEIHDDLVAEYIYKIVNWII